MWHVLSRAATIGHLDVQATIYTSNEVYPEICDNSVISWATHKATLTEYIDPVAV